MRGVAVVGAGFVMERWSVGAVLLRVELVIYGRLTVNEGLDCLN